MSYHISVTGHRPDRLVGGYELDSESNIILFTELYKILRFNLQDKGHITVHSGMALGVDTIFALAAIQLKDEFPTKVKIVAEIPCRGQEARWPLESRELYQDLIALVDEQKVYQHLYTKSCMFERNRGMVKASDLVIAVYDGSKKGGTYHAVSVAEKQGKDIYLLNDEAYLHKRVDTGGF